MKKSVYIITFLMLLCSAANVCFAQTRAGGRVHVNRHDVQRAAIDKNAWKEKFPDNCDNRNAGNRNFQLVSPSNGHLEVYAVWYGGQIEHYAKYQFELGMVVNGTETKLFDGKGDVSAISNDPSKYSSNPGFAATITMDPQTPFGFYIKYVDTDGKTVTHYSDNGYASLITLYFANINRTVVCIGFEDSPEAEWGNGNPDFNDVVIYVQDAIVTEKTEAKRFFCETMDSTGDYDYNDIVFDVHPLNNGKTEVTILALGDTSPVELSVAGQTIHEYGETDLHKIFNTGYTKFNVGGSEVKEARTFLINAEILDLANFTNVAAKVTDSDDKQRIIRYNAKSSKGEAIIDVPVGSQWMQEGVNIRRGYPKFFIAGWYNECAGEYLVDYNNYFRLKAVGGDVTLGIQKTGNPADCILQFSLDGKNWGDPKTLTGTTASLVIIPAGGTCYIRRGSLTPTDKISDDADNCWTFTMSSSDDNAIVEADGDIMTLLDRTDRQTDVSNDAAFLYLFRGCTYLKSVTIKSPVLLNSGQLRDIFGTQVTKYVIATNATTIGNAAFQNTAIISMTIPEGVTSIGNAAFQGCSGLTSIEIPATVQSIGDNAFYRCGITEYTLNCPSTCTFGSRVFPSMGEYNIVVPPLTTHSWTENPMWSTYGTLFTEPEVTLQATEDPDNAGNYYATFYNSYYAYTLPEGVTAYRAMTVGDAAVSLTPMEGTELPQGEPVLLQAASESIVLPLTTPSATPSADNALSGVDVQTAPAAGLSHYILSYGAQGVGFYQLPDGWKLEANKAYIAVDAPSPQMTRGLSLTFSDGTTGMESLDETDSSSVQTYNLFGQRIDQPVKAVNIVNGKKVYVK